MTIASGITITPLPATLGATVTGIRLAALDDAGWRAVEAGFHAHGLLIFPGQHLSDEEQQSFGRRFGRLEPGLELVVITNLTPDGRVRPLDDIVMDLLRGNEGWHTDSSSLPLAAKASMLSAHVVPSRGGETEWADMRAAYDALDDDVRSRVDTMVASHSLVRSQQRMGLGHAGDDFYGFGEGPDPVRPLVKVHPATGRPALFIGRHAYGIPGLDPAESEAFLDELLEAACRPPRVLTHRWDVGDLVVWDNRCVLHRVRPWDRDEPRVMVHTRISGDPVTEGV
jgi:alpha-ketoglutarate-dependent taurine dioxygenase